ncbi:hypothetical protein Q8F55_000563 [Vanrija albida]|uniref:Uncharacterized protein n=1 Tax=Vanrija albida TaxID=181172 RepID=A0ABR3QDM0_9TREE
MRTAVLCVILTGMLACAAPIPEAVTHKPLQRCVYDEFSSCPDIPWKDMTPSQRRTQLGINVLYGFLGVIGVCMLALVVRYLIYPTLKDRYGDWGSRRIYDKAVREDRIQRGLARPGLVVRGCDWARDCGKAAFSPVAAFSARVWGSAATLAKDLFAKKQRAHCQPEPMAADELKGDVEKASNPSVSEDDRAALMSDVAPSTEVDVGTYLPYGK